MPLRARLIASFACTFLLSLGFGCTLTWWHAVRSVRAELATALDIASQTVRTGLGELPQSTDPVHELQRLIGAFDGDRHVQASLLDGRGAVLARSRLLAPGARAPLWFAGPIDPALPAVEIASGGNAVRLQANAANEMGEVWGDFRDLTLVLALFGGVNLLAISWTVSHALRPVNGLLAALARIGSGDYAARITASGPPEIAALAGRFNQMAAHLAEVQTQNLRLQEQLLSLQDEERAELARELHDEIGPFLFAASMTAATIQHLAESGRTLDIPEQAHAIQAAVAHVQRHVRALLGRLRPLRAVEFGLANAIDDLIAFWRGLHPGIAFSALISADEASMGETLKETVYRIVQESLSNAVRHGQPSQVAIAIADGGGATHLRVSDDGAGPGSVSPQAGRPRFGVAGMRERAAALGGSLTAGTAEGGRGWLVTARLPGGAPA